VKTQPISGIDDELQVPRGQLRALIEAARGMTEGNFNRLVSIKAKDEIGQLAYYINQTLQNLQQLDPTVKGSSREIPKASSQLFEVVRTTEAATLKVLDETEKILEEQECVAKEIHELKNHLMPLEAGRSEQNEIMRALETMVTLNQSTLERAMAIIGAMEFQDLTTQKIETTLTLMEEVAKRLVSLLFLFRLQESSPYNPTVTKELEIIDRLHQDGQLLSSKQALVDQLLAEYSRVKE
jgi:chemotaxis regulatin CheY-phosphate phosphatase CheZ